MDSSSQEICKRTQQKICNMMSDVIRPSDMVNTWCAYAKSTFSFGFNQLLVL